MKSLEEILLPLFAANQKFYGTACQIVVCGSIVPDPLQTLALGVCSQLTEN